jgi:hypothetical protein
MSFKVIAVTLALSVICSASQAQTTALSFDQAAYVTCKEAQAMTPAARQALATFLAEHAARRRGVTIPEDQRGGQIGYLVRGGCTLHPDAYLLVVIDRAIIAEHGKLPKR